MSFPLFIALADDHEMLRKSIAGLLQINGFIIVQAANGKELITQLDGCNTLPDVCIIDSNMPEMNGCETAKYVRKKWPSVRILGLSMMSNDKDIIKMIGCGADGYLFKGNIVEELIEAVTQIHTIRILFE